MPVDTDTNVVTLAPPDHRLDEGDHDKFAHIVYPKEAILESALTGAPVIALCGKVWQPNSNPDRYSTCTMCIEEFENLRGRPWWGPR